MKTSTIKEGVQMTDQPKKESAPETKKMSLKDAIRNKLAQNKQQQMNEKNNPSLKAGNMEAKSQMTKKINNQRRRTGGS
jgi:prophage antirepressor-like protein